MTTTQAHIDLSPIKQRQRWTWASGDYSVIAARIMLIAERLVDGAGLCAGDAVLDVATGTGNAAIAAACCGYRVTGVDYVEGLLDRGRERAATEGLSVNFIEGDAEDLPFPEASFDTVPVRKAFDALGERGRDRLSADLARLADRHDREPGPTMALPSEYLEAVAVRAS